MSDMRQSSVTTNAIGFSPGRAVRVQRSGNSKVMPIPAEAGRAAHVELGEEYILEIRGSDLVYRAVDAAVHLVGSGAGQVGILSVDQVMAAPQSSSAAPLDWDF